MKHFGPNPHATPDVAVAPTLITRASLWLICQCFRGRMVDTTLQYNVQACGETWTNI